MLALPLALPLLLPPLLELGQLIIAMDYMDKLNPRTGA